MDEDVRSAMAELARRALADRLLLTVLAAQVMRLSPDPTIAAAWLKTAAAEAAREVAPDVIPDLREVLEGALNLAEAR